VDTAQAAGVFLVAGGEEVGKPDDGIDQLDY
jgi:hypothetical protein